MGRSISEWRTEEDSNGISPVRNFLFSLRGILLGICVMTPRPVSPPQHTKTIIASWIYQEGKIYFVTWRSTHPRHVAAGNGTWDDVIMEIHMKRKDSFALRLCVMKENVIYYKSKLVDKRTEVPLNWRSLPVQELPEFTSLTPLP